MPQSWHLTCSSARPRRLARPADPLRQPGSGRSFGRGCEEHECSPRRSRGSLGCLGAAPVVPLHLPDTRLVRGGRGVSEGAGQCVETQADLRERVSMSARRDRCVSMRHGLETDLRNGRRRLIAASPSRLSPLQLSLPSYFSLYLVLSISPVASTSPFPTGSGTEDPPSAIRVPAAPHLGLMEGRPKAGMCSCRRLPMMLRARVRYEPRRALLRRIVSIFAGLGSTPTS